MKNLSKTSCYELECFLCEKLSTNLQFKCKKKTIGNIDFFLFETSYCLREFQSEKGVIRK